MARYSKRSNTDAPLCDYGESLLKVVRTHQPCGEGKLAFLLAPNTWLPLQAALLYSSPGFHLPTFTTPHRGPLLTPLILFSTPLSLSHCSSQLLSLTDPHSTCSTLLFLSLSPYVTSGCVPLCAADAERGRGPAMGHAPGMRPLLVQGLRRVSQGEDALLEGLLAQAKGREGACIEVLSPLQSCTDLMSGPPGRSHITSEPPGCADAFWNGMALSLHLPSFQRFSERTCG